MEERNHFSPKDGESPILNEIMQSIENDPASILKFQDKFSDPKFLSSIIPKMMASDFKKDNTKDEKTPRDKAEDEKICGNQYFKNGNYEVAIEHYIKANEYDPTNIVYCTNLAIAYYNLQKFDLSEQAAKRAISTGKRNLATSEQMSKAYAKLSAAQRALNKTIESNESKRKSDMYANMNA